MYAYIKGTLTHATSLHVTVEAHGVGYLLAVPATVFTKLPPVGSSVQFFTSFVVREDTQALYGFLQVQERDCFDSLLGVTGIGPKMALSIIGHLALSDLHTAVATGDIPSLCKIPGVGRKTAERLLIEMRGKLPVLVADSSSQSLEADPRAQTIRDAMGALIHLGYSQSTAQKAIKNSLQSLPEAVDLSTLITAALKNV